MSSRILIYALRAQVISDFGIFTPPKYAGRDEHSEFRIRHSKISLIYDLRFRIAELFRIRIFDFGLRNYPDHHNKREGQGIPKSAFVIPKSRCLNPLLSKASRILISDFGLQNYPDHHNKGEGQSIPNSAFSIPKSRCHLEF